MDRMASGNPSVHPYGLDPDTIDRPVFTATIRPHQSVEHAVEAELAPHRACRQHRPPIPRADCTHVVARDATIVDRIAVQKAAELAEVEMLRQQGLALGGSLENAIVISDTGVLNNGLRFDDEFVRHKILDVIGDMALVGYPMIGHLVAHRGGHALHTAFAARILEEPDAWVLVEGRVEAGQTVLGPLATPGPLQAN